MALAVMSMIQHCCGGLPKSQSSHTRAKCSWVLTSPGPALALRPLRPSSSCRQQGPGWPLAAHPRFPESADLLTEDSILSPCIRMFPTVQASNEAALCLLPATVLISGTTTRRMCLQPGPHRLRPVRYEGHACTCASCSFRGSVAGAPRVGLSRWTVAQRREVPPTEMLTVSTDLPAHTAIPRTFMRRLAQVPASQLPMVDKTPAKYLGANTSLIGEYLLKPLEIRKARASAVAQTPDLRVARPFGLTTRLGEPGEAYPVRTWLLSWNRAIQNPNTSPSVSRRDIMWACSLLPDTRSIDI